MGVAETWLERIVRILESGLSLSDVYVHAFLNICRKRVGHAPRPEMNPEQVVMSA